MSAGRVGVLSHPAGGHALHLPSPTDLTDPPALVAVARAARLTGNRDLERAARRLLKERWGIELSFRRAARVEVRRGD